VLDNEKGVERVVPIVRDIKNSTLSVAIIDENGNLVQPEKLACCKRIFVASFGISVFVFQFMPSLIFLGMLQVNEVRKGACALELKTSYPFTNWLRMGCLSLLEMGH